MDTIRTVCVLAMAMAPGTAVCPSVRATVTLDGVEVRRDSGRRSRRGQSWACRATTSARRGRGHALRLRRRGVPRTFAMKQVAFPIDVLFIAEDGTVSAIESLDPGDMRLVTSPSPSPLRRGAPAGMGGGERYRRSATRFALPPVAGYSCTCGCARKMRFTGRRRIEEAEQTAGRWSQTTPCRRARKMRRLGCDRGEKGTWPVAIPLSRRAGRGYRNIVCPIGTHYTASGGVTSLQRVGPRAEVQPACLVSLRRSASSSGPISRSTPRALTRRRS